MGLAAAGAYIREVRKVRRMTRPQLAEALGISDDQIQRMELGQHAMGGPALLRLIKAIDASYQELTQLLEDEQATVEDAQRMARAWVARPVSLRDRELTPEEEQVELFELALRRTGGDRGAAMRLLLRALDALAAE